MASHDPDTYCFECGHPHHLRVSCQMARGLGIRASERKKLHHEADNQSKKREMQRRTEKYRETTAFTRNTEKLPYQAMQKEMDRILDSLDNLSTQDLLSTDPELSVDMDNCTAVGNAFLSLESEAKEILGQIRGISLAATKKLSEFEGSYLDKDIFKGKISQLKETRDTFWKNLQEKKVKTRNVRVTVEEFLNLKSEVDDWCQRYTLYFSSHPQDVDYEVLDQKWSLERGKLDILFDRALFLKNFGGLGEQPMDMAEESRKRVRDAKKTRLLFESKESECPICLENKIESFFQCGHGTCYSCREGNIHCTLCGEIVVDVNIADFF